MLFPLHNLVRCTYISLEGDQSSEAIELELLERISPLLKQSLSSLYLPMASDRLHRPSEPLAGGRGARGRPRARARSLGFNWSVA